MAMIIGCSNYCGWASADIEIRDAMQEAINHSNQCRLGMGYSFHALKLESCKE